MSDLQLLTLEQLGAGRARFRLAGPEDTIEPGGALPRVSYNDLADKPDLTDFATKTGEETLSGKTLAVPVVKGYTEANAAPAAATSFVPDLSIATVFHFTTSGHAAMLMPPAVAGKSFSARFTYGGAHSLAFTPDGTDHVEWAGGTPPTPTSTNGAHDVFAFTCYAAGTWTGFAGGLKFS